MYSNFTDFTRPSAPDEDSSSFIEELESPDVLYCSYCYKSLDSKSPKCVYNCSHCMHINCSTKWLKNISSIKTNLCNMCYSGNTQSGENNIQDNEKFVKINLRTVSYDANGNEIFDYENVYEKSSDLCTHVNDLPINRRKINEKIKKSVLLDKQKYNLLKSCLPGYIKSEISEIVCDYSFLSENDFFPLDEDESNNTLPGVDFSLILDCDINHYQLYNIGFDTWDKFLSIPNLDKFYFLPSYEQESNNPIFSIDLISSLLPTKSNNKFTGINENFIRIGPISKLYGLKFCDLKACLDINLIDLAYAQITPREMIFLGLNGRVLIGDDQPQIIFKSSINNRKFHTTKNDYKMNNETFSILDKYIEDNEWINILGFKEKTLLNLRKKNNENNNYVKKKKKILKY